MMIALGLVAVGVLHGAAVGATTPEEAEEVLGLDATPDMGITGPPPDDTHWTDVVSLGIRGHGWDLSQLGSPYTRLPSHAQQTLCSSSPCASPCAVPTCEADRCAVWGLSQTATGLHVRFQTSATQVHVRWSMIPENGDWLWALGGHSGVDFYVQDDTTNGAWRWGVASGNNPGAVGGSMAAAALAQTTRYKNFTATLGVMASGRVRNVTLYLPSRGTVASVAVGVAPTDTVTPLPMDATPKPVTVYGTSILHGAAAGRPGMVYSSQMERYIGMPVVNLGFSGHGLMQQEVSTLLSEVESSLYVLDCEYNMDRYNESEVECLAYNFLKALRKAHPTTPVLLIEGHDGTVNWMSPSGALGENQTRNGYRSAFNKVLAEGDTGVYYLNGSGKLGGPLATDFEAQVGAVGGVHVSNYAFHHFATYIGDKVMSILNGTADTEPVELLQETPAPPKPPRNQQWGDWVEATQLGLEGMAFQTESRPYGRLPKAAEADFAAAGGDTLFTYNLSQCSSGVLVRFQTNATELQINVARHSLGDSLLSLKGRQDDIMPYNGRFGIDLYASDENNGGAWRWFDTSKSGSEQESETLIAGPFPPLTTSPSRAFTVFFPTHIAVDSLRVRVPASATLVPYRPYESTKPIAIWASSIGHGGVVQNAGLTWIVDVGRILNRPILNFGFSGNCRMQPEVAKYLVQTKPGVFVMDCLPNMDAATVTSRAPAILKQLREGLGPDVPIVVLEGHTYTNAWLIPSVASGQEAKRQAQRTAVAEAAKTDPNLHYVEGDGKLASLGSSWYDATSGVGVHPTNVAHLHIAHYVATALKPLLPTS